MTRDLKKAIAAYQVIADKYGKTDRPVAADALLRMAEGYQKLGDQQATKVFQRVIREFADQPAAVTARTRLGAASRTQPGDMLTQRVAGGADVLRFGRVSPDGRYIAVEAGPSLRLRELVTGHVRELGGERATENGWVQNIVFSPDGRHVAYELTEKAGASLHGTLKSMATEAQPAMSRTLYDNPEVMGIAPLDWSADGRLLAVLIRRVDHTAQIGLVSVTDGSLQLLKSIEWVGAGGLRFSPDSLSIAYHRQPSSGAMSRDVFVIAVNGGKETSPLVNPGDDRMIEWTADGESLLVASDRGGSAGLWRVPVGRGGTPELIKADVGHIGSQGLTRSGVLYYKTIPGSAEIFTAQYDAAARKLTTAPVKAMPRFKGFNSQPEWSSDGKSIAVVSQRDVGRRLTALPPTIEIRSLESGAVRHVQPAASYFASPRWSPDGRLFVAYGADLKGREGILKIDAVTGETSLVVPSDTCFSHPYWAPDGKSFYCFFFDGRQILEVDVASGSVRRRLDSFSAGTGISPDGRYLLAGISKEDRNALQLIPLVAGDPVKVVRLPMRNADTAKPAWQMNFVGTASWNPDGEGILFFGGVAGDTGLWFLPIEGGQPHKILAVEAMATLRVSATSGQILFASDDASRVELWKLQNYLPAGSSRIRQEGRR